MAKPPTKKVKELSLTPAREKSKPIPTVSALNPAQKQAIRSIASVDNTIVFINGIAGTGKAETMDSTVYTPFGKKRMGDIYVGDIVCTPDGGISNVVGVFPQGVKPIFKVLFSDGSFVRCCGEHLWEVKDRQKGKKYASKSRVYSTDYMRTAIENTSRGKSRFYIPTTQPAFFATKDVPLEPYFLGAMLGDGCMVNRALTFTSADKELVSSVSQHVKLHPLSRSYDYGLRYDGNENIDATALNDLGLLGCKSYEKFIPTDYIYNSVEVRTKLLQGIMDTDGYVTKSGGCEITTTSSKLCDDIKEISESLGAVCTVKTRHTTYTYKGEKRKGRLSYRLHIRIADPASLFTLQRKKDLCIKRTMYKPNRHITNILPDGEEEAQCIMLDSESHLYLTDNFIVTHNTYIATSWGLEQFVKGKFERLVFTRPYVEAGESLGYLPGTFGMKIAPFMIPIFDVLHEHLSNDDIEHLVKENRIVTLPIAYMRGVTFKNSFVLLDEGQNTTIRQMHLFLTRVGQGSKVVVTGDASQSDIRGENGFADALNRLQGINGLEIVELDSSAVVRHAIIPEIDKRYVQS